MHLAVVRNHSPSRNVAPKFGGLDKGARETTGQGYARKAVVHLYFADREAEFLTAEKKTLVPAEDAAAFAKMIIESLINGPQEGRMRTIPEKTILRALYVPPEGPAYVDLSGTIRDNHPGGCRSELMTIYSIVNSLVLNVPEINAVKILIDGNDSMTLTGHIDLRFPFKANMLLVR